MRRKILALILIAIISLSSVGCSESEDDNQKYYWQSFYEEANYQKYNTPASENGLDGTLISVTGKVDDILKLEDMEQESIGIILKDNNKKTWMAFANTEGNTFPEKGEKITAYMNYGGLTAKYNDYPCGFLLRYISGNRTEKIKSEGYFYWYVSDEEAPEGISDWDVKTELGIDYYDVYLGANVDWSSMDMDEQTDLIEKYVEYFRDYSTATRKDKYSVNIMAMDSSGNNAFYCDRSDKIKIYTDGVYDYEYYIVK